MKAGREIKSVQIIRLPLTTTGYYCCSNCSQGIFFLFQPHSIIFAFLFTLASSNRTDQNGERERERERNAWRRPRGRHEKQDRCRKGKQEERQYMSELRSRVHILTPIMEQGES